MSLKEVMKYVQKLKDEAAGAAGVAATPAAKPSDASKPASTNAVNQLESPSSKAKQDQPKRKAAANHAQSMAAWQHLDRAYQVRHLNCPVCIAAGLGYGLRCGVGAALWVAYADGAAGVDGLGG